MVKQNQFHKVKSLSRVQLFVTPWTIAHQVPSSMEFSRQEYWSALPFNSIKKPQIKVKDKLSFTKHSSGIVFLHLKWRKRFYQLWCYKDTGLCSKP